VIAAAWICLALPLGAALAITLLGTRISRRGAGYLATGATGSAFVAAAVAFVDLLGKPAGDRSHTATIWTWITGGTFQSGLRILVDPLSVMMMLIVSGVGALIVMYSIGYMDRDDEERRFFAYMALFVFSMLLLVEAGNLLILLVGWGLVGLSSYVLIGFWHERPSAIAAAKKAFVMNAVGDATMALALFALIQHVGTLNFPGAFAIGPRHGWLVDLVALGLLGGAVAKSAQIPLHTWLPDAMEGPTPVSALIHAATMVTAGVYLIVRTHAIFELAPRVEELAAGLGAATLVMAGLIALVQTDIKRVIAYSTMSQIGYMFLGVGLGAYANGMFHLMTHAFFKALLFLAAGLVIHALAGEQDMRQMGGLRRLMPRTWAAFGIGALALAGIPPFAGFFSKDSILAAALGRGWYGIVLWIAGLVGVFLTAAYAFRMLFLVFEGEPSQLVREHLAAAGEPRDQVPGHGRGAGPSEQDASRPHGQPTHAHSGEGPFSMTAPVAVLALDAGVELARAGRATARRGLGDAGDDLDAARARPLGARDRRRVDDLRRPPPRAAPLAVPAAAVRAEVLLGRALRRALLLPRRVERPPAPPRCGAPARRGFRRRRRPRLPRARQRHPPPADGARPLVRARDRREPCDLDDRLRGGAVAPWAG
jgi:NADH-quinone oxidoreductase subunit L